MLSYAVKRIMRSSGLFAALLLGVVLASTFFAGVNIGADATAKAALDQQLSRVPSDIVIEQYGLASNSAVWTAAVAEVAQVDGIVGVEVISRAYWYGNTSFQNDTSFSIVGISSNSRVYKGLTITSGASSLGVNETYVWAGSKSAEKMELNSTLTLNFTYRIEYLPVEKSFGLTLKVAGFVELSDTAYSIVTGQWYGYGYWSAYQTAQVTVSPPPPVYEGDLLIVSWEETFAKLLDMMPSDVPYYSIPCTTQILAYVDRDALINPWDIPGSLEALRTVTARVNQAVMGHGMSVSNNLENTLMMYQFTSMAMRFSFFIVALPVFFVAWYVGTTVSDVSYNIRRREIGLLLTKGFSNRQLFRMFLTESILIGVIGALIGVGLGYILSPVFAAAVGGEWAAPMLSREVIVVTFVFSLAITLLSTFRPSRRASKLSAVDALREYMYVEEVKPYKQRLPWLAFALGLYKIVMFLLGIDLAQVFFGRPPPFANIFLLILLAVWIFIDSLLTYIGPLLFFWGFTKIFIHGSLKFQELVTKVAKFLGDLGALATKNVRRNPARAASVAFLIALIIGYSFQTIGAVASEQDYIIRNVKASVGADISVAPTSTTNVSQVAKAIENLSGVASVTVEYSLSATLSPQFYSSQIRAVDPDKWLSIAYYEDEWFSGNDVAKAFQLMKMDNRTIILERNVAETLGKKVGDNVTLTIGGSTLQLTIVGFFGPETAQATFWSYTPIGLCDLLDSEPSALRFYASARVLVKLEPDADGKLVASEIRNLGDVGYVRSMIEELETYQSNISLIGSINIQRIGVVFSILAASVATGLATFVSLQERKREVSIMNARGLSLKQLVTILLTENLAVVVFSAALGIAVGLIVARGNVQASNAALSYSLVMHRIVFPPDAIILLSTCLILVFASTIAPVILLTKRYTSKVERIVRL